VFIAAVAFGAQSASAAEPQANVRFADLDLARVEGAQALYGRIRAAAESVCAPLDGRRLEEIVRFRSCVGDALARAVSEVNRPTLTDYYQSKLGAHDRVKVAVAAR
jgi:UrcA family protein